MNQGESPPPLLSEPHEKPSRSGIVARSSPTRGSGSFSAPFNAFPRRVQPRDLLSTLSQLLLDAVTYDGQVDYLRLLALDVDHPFAGMSRAELRLRLSGASCVTAPLVADVDHALLGVPAAEFRLSAPIHAEIRPRGAIWIVTNLAADMNHAFFSVPAAELRLLVGVVLTIAGSGAATGVAASVGSDVDHPVLGVPRAVLCLSPLHAVHRLCFTA